MVARKYRALSLGMAIGLLGLVQTVQSAQAHNVHVDGEVAATFHLEPSHNPKAGEPAKLWFALAKKGGESIALSDCDCQLNVMQGGKVIATPALSGIDVEKYREIPGATVTFPAVGLYAVVLSGKAKAGSKLAFEAFKLNYDVTVQAGTAQASKVSEVNPQGVAEGEEGGVKVLPILLGVGAIGAIAALTLFLNGKRNP
jgi:hypothetical protein